MSKGQAGRVVGIVSRARCLKQWREGRFIGIFSRQKATFFFHL